MVVGFCFGEFWIGWFCRQVWIYFLLAALVNIDFSYFWLLFVLLLILLWFLSQFQLLILQLFPPSLDFSFELGSVVIPNVSEIEVSLQVMRRFGGECFCKCFASHADLRNFITSLGDDLLTSRDGRLISVEDIGNGDVVEVCYRSRRGSRRAREERKRETRLFRLPRLHQLI
jgi:hypothetical protein